MFVVASASLCISPECHRLQNTTEALPNIPCDPYIWAQLILCVAQQDVSLEDK